MQQQGYSIPGYFIIIFCLSVFNSFSVPLLHSKTGKFLFMKVNTSQSYSARDNDWSYHGVIDWEQRWAFNH